MHTIDLIDFGAHARFSANLDGFPTIRGRSAAGKSTIIDAWCWCLWGTDRYGKAFRPIRTGSSRCTVTVQVGARTVTRTQTVAGTVTRTLDGVKYATDAALGTALGFNAALVRAIVASDVWQELARGKLDGQPLRDVVAAVLPPIDLKAGVAAKMLDGWRELRKQDPLDLRTAEKQRTEANARRERSAGRLASAQEAARATPPVVEMPDTSAAQLVLAAAEVWRTHDLESQRSDASAQAADTARRAIEDWDRRRAEIGELDDPRPSPLRPEQVDLARSSRRGALTALDTARALVVRLEAAQEATSDADEMLLRTRSELATAEQALSAAGGPCPTCGMARGSAPAHLVAAVEEARGAVATAEAGVSFRVGALRTAAARQMSDAAEAVVRAQADVSRWEARVEEEEAALTHRRAKLDAADAHRRALTALGARPEIPAVLPRPTVPSVARPSPEDLAAARDLIARAERSRGEIAAHARAAEGAAATAERETVQHEAAVEEAAHMEALVEALRVVPGELAAKQQAALGDLGTVSLDWTETGIVVKVNGRPWDETLAASRGELVIAGLHLRAALRRASGLDVPIFVDDATAWSGGWPDVGMPVVFLVTADEDIAVDGGTP